LAYCAITHSVVTDLGRSRGKLWMRSQTSCGCGSGCGPIVDAVQTRHKGRVSRVPRVPRIVRIVRVIRIVRVVG
jgi:hypothetical protein